MSVSICKTNGRTSDLCPYKAENCSITMDRDIKENRRLIETREVANPVANTSLLLVAMIIFAYPIHFQSMVIL
jgi:hypothetical protein